MKQYLVLVVLSFSMIILSCKKNSQSECIENYKGQVNLSPEEKMIHPYGLNDSLVFLNVNYNNYVSYKCAIQLSVFLPSSKSKPNNEGLIECLGDYYNLERYTTQFNDIPTNWIKINLWPPDPFDTSNHKALMQIFMSIPGDSIDHFEGWYALTKDSLYDYFDSPAPHISRYFETKTISGTTYHKVYWLQGYTGSPLPDRITQIFYSLSDGIIEFSTNEHKVWDLKGKYILH